MLLLFYVLTFSIQATVSFGKRPNIIIILTDDLDVELGGLNPLKKTKVNIGDEGIYCTNAFVTTPICCPSRSSILTGLYLHSHGVVNNSLEGGCSGLKWQKKFETNTFGSILQNHNYKTFYAGKYLNRYGYKSSGGVGHVPKGWDWWIGLVGNSAYYNYTLSVNGSKVRRGTQESDYLTDVIKEYSLKFLNEYQTFKNEFLMFINPPSPHEPFTPAKRHLGKYDKIKAPRTPNFNKLTDKNGKHWLLRLPPNELPSNVIERIDTIYRNRWETLLSVDELVETIIMKLKKLNILNETYIIFTSDNGFHMGQFELPWDKRQPYETDIRVPLMIRGPGIRSRKRKKFKHVVLNIDLAPTILEMSGIREKYKMDGKSILNDIIESNNNNNNNDMKSRNFLVEYEGEHDVGRGKKNPCYEDNNNLKLCYPETCCKCFDSKNNTYLCLRRISGRENIIFCLFDDDESFIEFYDINRDPYQQINLSRQINIKFWTSVLDCCRHYMKFNMNVVDYCFHRFKIPEII